LLILCKLNDDLMPKYRKMFAFVSQLKAGKGLTVCMSVIPGDYVKRHQAAITAKQNLRKHMDDERVKGFVDVLITKNVADGLSHM
jgi:solute carrier family 12 (potassium/chloride transporter), member 4/6